MSKKHLIILVILITLVGAFLRFYKNTQNPPSLTGDEISFGYSAYSVLMTGKDEFGKFLPLTFKSVGDYKNPLPAYLMIPSIQLFGLNDFAIRFPNALFGTLMIPVYFLFLLKILKDKKVALIGASILSISAWQIFYSRFGYEPLIASFFILLGVWSYLKMIEGKFIWVFVSAFFFILTMYTAFAPRLFIPVFVLALLIFNFKKIDFKKAMAFVASCFVFSLPLLYVSVFEGAGTRFSMVFIGNDIDFKRYVIFGDIKNINDVVLLIFYCLKRYLNYLQPDLLFINGLGMTAFGTFGLGLIYLFELPAFILGVYEFIKNKIPYKGILTIWLLTGLIPDSLTNNQQHAGRLLHIAPVVILFTSLGTIKLFKVISKISLYKKMVITAVFVLFISLNLMHAFLTFSTHFPNAKGESFDEGLREAVLFVQNNQENYKEVVFDPRRGMDGPFLISNPYLYLLFYTKYDPQTYQNEPKVFGTGSEYYYRFNKYTFRPIEWNVDKNSKNTLFIGSPWSLPQANLKEGEILQKIYLSNGALAFLIVSPK